MLEYLCQSVCPDSDWPPLIGEQYTELALIEHERQLEGEEYAQFIAENPFRDNIHRSAAHAFQLSCLLPILMHSIFLFSSVWNSLDREFVSTVVPTVHLFVLEVQMFLAFVIFLPCCWVHT